MFIHVIFLFIGDAALTFLFKKYYGLDQAASSGNHQVADAEMTLRFRSIFVT
jgi:hypothetical protein